MVHKLSFSKFFSYCGLAILSIFFFIACTEKPLQVGVEILPDGDSLGVGVDTLSVQAFNISNPPILESAWYTDKAPSRKASLGYTMDPVFGESKAEISFKYMFEDGASYTPSEENKDFQLKIRFRVDPSILHGDTANIEVDVFELSSVSIAGENSDYVMKSEDFDDEYMNVDRGKLVILDIEDGVNENDTIRVYFDVEMKQSLIERLTASGDIYETESAFIEDFKGFYVQPIKRNGPGGMHLIVPESSSMILSYTAIDTVEGKVEKDSAITVNKSINYNFEFVHNMFHHAHSFSQIEGLNDTLNEPNRIYIQSLAGTRSLLKLDNIYDFVASKEGALAVNKAELVIPVSSTKEDRIYNWPTYMGLRTEEGALFYGESYLEGALIKDSTEYRLNITPYLHQVISGRIINRMYLYASTRVQTQNSGTSFSPSLNTPQKVVVNSGANTKPMFVRIIYSELPNPN